MSKTKTCNKSTRPSLFISVSLYLLTSCLLHLYYSAGPLNVYCCYTDIAFGGVCGTDINIPNTGILHIRRIS